MHSLTQGGAFVFQLADLKRKQNGAQIGERGGAPQLSQPGFEGDLTPGNDSVFSNHFHCLLIYPSVSHASRQSADHGYYIYLSLI